MSESNLRRLLCIASLGLGLTTLTAAVAEVPDTDPISEALLSSDPDVQRFNEHITMLASEYMEGRVPGGPGMERAKDYVEYFFRDFGLEAPFTAEDGTATYRNPFDLGGEVKLKRAETSMTVGGRKLSFAQDSDFVATGLGGSGEVTGGMVFVGYSVEDGPDGYESYEDDADLTGKIAVMLRFEPMDEEGVSQWGNNGRWSGRANFRGKVRAAFDRGAEGIVIINPPGSADPRADRLAPMTGGGRPGLGPVVMLSQEAGDMLMKAASPRGRSLMEMREWADANGGTVELRGAATIAAEFEVEPLIAENVGGMLPGRGALADEVIVIGAHLDHLGLGYFGSRGGTGELHPGADDNASGSAGIMLVAEWLAESYAQVPEDQPLRSVLFMAFSGEESGLNGSRAYANAPLGDIEDHVLMMNFDMIGRISNNRVSVSGISTGEGMAEFVQPFFDESPLEVVVPETMSGASDHTSFYNQSVPVLFAIIADFHEDYHTPADTIEKINRVGATHTARLFHDIALAFAQRGEAFAFQREARRAPARGSRAGTRVLFGVMPDVTDSGESGIRISSVTDGGSASVAGVLEGDVLVRWDGQKIKDMGHWMELLAGHEPGDEIKIGVMRDDVEVTLDVTLQAR